MSLDLLGRALKDAGDPAGAEAVLRRAQQRHPGDVWINYDLASSLEKLARREEAIRYYTAARSLRPETAHGWPMRWGTRARGTKWFFLAMALWQRGEKDRSRFNFDQALAWTKKNDLKDADRLAVWCEAADLLGQPSPTRRAAAGFAHRPVRKRTLRDTLFIGAGRLCGPEIST